MLVERQRSVMEAQFTMFWNHPSVMSVTGQMRPTMTWLMQYLNR